MKTLIKLLIILVAVAGIGFGVWSLIGDSTEIQPATISEQENQSEVAEKPQSEFEAKIQEKLNEQMPDKSKFDLTLWGKAKENIDNEIKTAATMTLSDGTTQISQEIATRCHKMVFNHYALGFLAQSDTFFAQSSWNEATMNSLKNEAAKLLNDQYCEKGNNTAIKLSKINGYVTSYFGAKSLIARASSCNSLSEVKSCRSEVAKYKQFPLTNCTSIMSQLNGVPQKAVNSYSRIITSRANNVANNFDTYSSLVEFNKKYRTAMGELNAFSSEFGNTSDISSAKNNLQNAKTKAPRAYVQKGIKFNTTE